MSPTIPDAPVARAPVREAGCDTDTRLEVARVRLVGRGAEEALDVREVDPGLVALRQRRQVARRRRGGLGVGQPRRRVDDRVARLGILDRLAAADGADLALERADAGLHRVVRDDVHQRLVRQFDLGGGQRVGLELLGKTARGQHLLRTMQSGRTSNDRRTSQSHTSTQLTHRYLRPMAAFSSKT